MNLLASKRVTASTGDQFTVEILERGESEDVLVRVLDPADAKARPIVERVVGIGSTDGRDELLSASFDQAKAQQILDARVLALVDIAAARLKGRSLKAGLK